MRSLSVRASLVIPNTKLQSKVEFVMLSGVRSEAEERNEASAKPFTTFEGRLRVAKHLSRFFASLSNDMIERNSV